MAYYDSREDSILSPLKPFYIAFKRTVRDELVLKISPQQINKRACVFDIKKHRNQGLRILGQSLTKVYGFSRVYRHYLPFKVGTRVAFLSFSASNSETCVTRFDKLGALWFVHCV